MLSDFAGFLWGLLVDLFRPVVNGLQMIANFMGALFGDLKSFLGKLLGGFLDGLVRVLKILFKPIFDLIGAIFHLIEKLIEFLGLLLLLFLKIGQIIIAFVQGLFTTLAGLNYDGSTPTVDSTMTQTIQAFVDTMNLLDLNNIAYLLLFGIWVFTAVIVIRMIGNFKA